MAARHLIPRRPAWLLATVLAGLAALVVYGVLSWRSAWAPGRPGGLVFGTAAAFIVFVEALYPLRRRLRVPPLGTSERWLQFHIHAGVLLPLLAALHVGFQLPAGRLGLLMILTGAWSVVSGMLGVALQKHLPAVLAGELSVEAAYERIPQLTGRLQQEADALMHGAPAMLDHVYQREIRPSLSTLQPSWYYLLDTATAARRRLAPLAGVQAFVDDDERGRLEDLAAIVTEKHQLDVQYSLQRVLRHWLVLHVPVAYLFAGLLVLHIVLVLSF